MSYAGSAIMPSSYPYPSRSNTAPVYNAPPSSHHPMSSNHPNHNHSRPPPHHQWTLAPSASPPSANPFSPTQHLGRPARSVSEIIPRLFISDLAFAENPALLASHRITHILSTLPDTIFQPPPTLLPVQPVRLQIRVEDLPFAELAAHLPTTTAWIRDALCGNAEARVLVHCVEGVSRSVSVVAAFLMAQYGWSPSEAIQYIKSKRFVADPNFGFIQQLHEYGRDSLGRAMPPPIPPFSPPAQNS